MAVLALFLACTWFPNGSASTSTKQQTDSPMRLIAATADLAESGTTRLHPNYIWATLKDREQDEEVNAAFQQALADGGTRESRLALIRVLELKFIHDPETSALDVLGQVAAHHTQSDQAKITIPTHVRVLCASRGGPGGPSSQTAGF